MVDLLGMKEDRYIRAAKVLLKKMERIVDQANWEHAAFVMLAADVMRSELGGEPKWLGEALNEGDGVYRP